MKVLEVDNIALHYKEKTILNAIYLKAETGKITGILGSNGCGKTSLLRIIFGELKSQNKLIRIDNKPILKPLYTRAIVKYLPQFHFIPDSFSVKKIFSLYKIDFNTFVESYPNYKAFEHTIFAMLSGGEKRLIEIYIILASDSKIVLLDEPFSYLSPVYVAQIKKLITSMKKEKIIILTDHLYKSILDISDDVYLLKNGWSKKIASPEELIFHEYTRSL